MSQRITIYRDGYGVPHVEADSDEGVCYGFGYAQAQDHLEDMVTWILRYSGSMASVLGPRHLETDLEIRRFRVPHLVTKEWDNSDVQVRRLIEAFVQGINDYVSGHRSEVPEWIPQITARQLVTAANAEMLFTWHISRVLSNKLPGREYPAIKGLYSLPGYSNSWAVARPKSAGDAAMVAIAPHLPFVGRFVPAEAHLHGERLRVAGATRPGLPFIAIGFNEHLAWTITAAWPDSGDAYIEQLDPSNPRRYRYDGKWREMDVIEERIPVRTDSGIEVTKHEIMCSHHGPVIEVDGDRAIAVKLAPYGRPYFMEELYLRNTATNIEEFKEAAHRFGRGCINLTCADASANLFYVHLVTVPIRPPGYDWSKAVPGWTSETEWKGLVPFEDLPQVDNPPEGYVMNCNDPAGASGAIVRLPAEDQAHVAINASKQPGLRGMRARELLQSRSEITLDDMKAFVMDEYVIGCESWHELLLKVYDEFKEELPDPQGSVARIAKRLRGWDRVASVHCKNMPFFYWWYVGLCGEKAKAQIDVSSREERKRAAALFANTVNDLVAEFGTEELTWGRIHVVRRGGSEFPVGGCGVYFPSLHHARPKHEGHKIVVVAGQVYTAVIGFNGMPEAYTVIPFGQSRDPNSPHYADQAPLNGDRKLKRFWFSLSDVMANAKSQTELFYEPVKDA